MSKKIKKMFALICGAIFLILMALPSQAAEDITEGNLYREVSHPEVYVIHQGKKVWIPTPDALFAMGYDWSKVRVVPDGALSNYPRFNIPSSSPTPGSLIFPPRPNHHPLTGIANATMVVSQGREIQIAELRGWFRGMAGAGECNTDELTGADYTYELELDTDWALAQGINLHRILRVGNVAYIGMMQTDSSPRKAVSVPIIKVELNSWGWRSRFPLTNKPQDWNHRQENCKPVDWPFDPDQPDHSRPQIQINDYVRISGSIVTDTPHDGQDWLGTNFCRLFAICKNMDAEWRSSVPDWAPGKSSEDSDHPARWTEIHPPDLIEILDAPTPRVTVRGVALAARVAATPGPIISSCEKQEFDITPEIPRPPSSKVAYEELRGPETFFPWGENSDNGSWVQVFDDRIHVKAQVCGGAIGGSPGRFKAIYRVWWQPSITTPPHPPRCCPLGKRCCGSCDAGRCDDACVRPGQQCP
jgi:hypothetical protein